MKLTLPILIFAILISNMALAEPLQCQVHPKGVPFFIHENLPQPGLATIVEKGGKKTILKFSQQILKGGTYGCMERAITKKTFFHPYYEFRLESTVTFGMPGTRCHGMRDMPSPFTGFLIGEMQDPQPVSCVPSNILNFPAKGFGI